MIHFERLTNCSSPPHRDWCPPSCPRRQPQKQEHLTGELTAFDAALPPRVPPPRTPAKPLTMRIKELSMLLSRQEEKQIEQEEVDALLLSAHIDEILEKLLRKADAF